MRPVNAWIRAAASSPRSAVAAPRRSPCSSSSGATPAGTHSAAPALSSVQYVSPWTRRASTTTRNHAARWRSRCRGSGMHQPKTGSYRNALARDRLRAFVSAGVALRTPRSGGAPGGGPPGRSRVEVVRCFMCFSISGRELWRRGPSEAPEGADVAGVGPQQPPTTARPGSCARSASYDEVRRPRSPASSSSASSSSAWLRVDAFGLTWTIRRSHSPRRGRARCGSGGRS